MFDLSGHPQISKLVPGITFLLGYFIQYLWGRYTSKLSRLHYYVKQSFLGATAEDARFGSVKMLYNDKPINNLYMTNVQVINASNKDFENLDIKLWCDIDSTILVSHGTKLSSITPLSFTDKYSALLSNISQNNELEVFTTRSYIIPVLNRADSMEFSCLMTNSKGKSPNVWVQCEYPGLRVELKIHPPQLFWKEPQHICAFIGFLTSLIVLIPIFYFIESRFIIAILSFLLGGLLVVPGAIVYKSYKRFKKLFI